MSQSTEQDIARLQDKYEQARATALALSADTRLEDAARRLLAALARFEAALGDGDDRPSPEPLRDPQASAGKAA